MRINYNYYLTKDPKNNIYYVDDNSIKQEHKDFIL